jgi:hypothetical protein
MPRTCDQHAGARATKEEKTMAALDSTPWTKARLALAAAVHDTGMTAAIHRVDGHQCSITFMANGRRYTMDNVGIAIIQDKPSPILTRYIGDAKIALGLA